MLSGFVSQGIAQPNERARELVDQLGSDSWLERDLATLDLANFNSEISLTELELFFSDITLSLEQRTRLKLVCIYRFTDYPKGGLGVSFGKIEPGSIEVKPISNNPNFPASAMLNPGDAIARVDGVMMTNSLDLRLQILSREPGEVLPVTVIRNNQLIEMELPLGSFSDLASGSRLDSFQSQLALEIRWERKGIVVDQTETIGSTITIDQWARVAFPDGTRPDARATSRRIVTAVVAGANQLVHAGLINIPRRFVPWTSSERLQERAGEITMMLVGQFELEYRARRALLVQESLQLTVEMDAASDEQEIQRLRNKIEILENEIAALDDGKLIIHAEP